MIVRRSATVSLKFSTEEKKKQLEALLEEYKYVVQSFVDLSWDNSSLKLNKESLFLVKETALSERFKSNALRQALSITIGTKKSAKEPGVLATKPEFKGTALLDAKFIFVNLDNPNFFDGWIRISTLHKGKRLWIPFKRTKPLNKWLGRGFKLVHSVRLRKYNGNLYADLILEKELSPKETGEFLGIDSGINKALSLSNKTFLGSNYRYYADKIRRKKHKSKAYYRALKERDNYLRQEINKIDFSSFKQIFAEDIKGIKKNTKKKKRVNHSVRKLFSVWVQGKTFRWLQNKCEENCVQFIFVPAKYTSQTCSKCGHREKSNRNKELFKCKRCSFAEDADYTASLNILSAGLRSLESLSSKPD